MAPLRLTLQSLLLALTLAACSACPDEAPAGSQTAAFVAVDEVWSTSAVNICWEDLTASTAADRALVEQGMAQEISAHVHVTFVGWAACPSDASGGIRISVADAVPKTRGLGSQLADATGGIRLNFTFKAWGQECSATDALRRQCIKATALHEFLHALGMAHENNRDDRPNACERESHGADGARKIGAFDDHSVMNYCNPAWNNGGTLSAGDLAALQSLYGAVGDSASTPAANEEDDACHA